MLSFGHVRLGVSDLHPDCGNVPAASPGGQGGGRGNHVSSVLANQLQSNKTLTSELSIKVVLFTQVSVHVISTWRGTGSDLRETLEVHGAERQSLMLVLA